MRHGDLFPKQAPLHAVKGFPGDLAEPFGRFWLAYPHRVPNPRALAAAEFARVVKAGATPDQLIAAAAAYAAEVKRLGTGNDFIVHARTFLRQGRWADYLEAAAEAAQPGPAEPTHELWPLLKNDMDAATFTAWIGRCRVERSGDLVMVIAPSAFIGSRVSDEFGVLLKRRLGRVSIHTPARGTP